jgi:hypothetical protein
MFGDELYRDHLHPCSNLESALPCRSLLPEPTPINSRSSTSKTRTWGTRVAVWDSDKVGVFGEQHFVKPCLPTARQEQGSGTRNMISSNTILRRAATCFHIVKTCCGAQRIFAIPFSSSYGARKVGHFGIQDAPSLGDLKRNSRSVKMTNRRSSFLHIKAAQNGMSGSRMTKSREVSQ